MLLSIDRCLSVLVCLSEEGEAHQEGVGLKQFLDWFWRICMRKMGEEKGRLG